MWSEWVEKRRPKTRGRAVQAKRQRWHSVLAISMLDENVRFREYRQSGQE